MNNTHMKKSTLLAAFAIGILLVSSNIDKVTVLDVKPEASKIEWFAEKVTGSHNGLVSLKEGKMEIDGEQIVGGSFVIDMTSINTTDLDGNMKDKLDSHLKSEDFFNSKEYNTAEFVIAETKKMTSKDGFNTEMIGQLTIKGISHPISFPANVKITDGKLAAYGEMVVDRTKYDIKYKSASFFESIGDKAIMDEFTLKVSIGAKL